MYGYCKYKTETSMKICNSFRKVYRIGYCDLQTIFNGVTPDYYNCGVYGWNCDLYVDYKHDAIITTGYRNMRGVRIPSELLNKYNKKASAINKKYSSWQEYDKRQKALEKNRERFLEELDTI